MHAVFDPFFYFGIFGAKVEQDEHLVSSIPETNDLETNGLVGLNCL